MTKKRTLLQTILVIAVLAIGFVSCTEEDFDRFDQDNKIGFNAMVGKSSLFKATELVATDFNQFTVYAYRTETDITTSTVNVIETYIHNLTVSKSEGIWTYQGAFYWPGNPNDRLQFYGYAGDIVTDWILPDEESGDIENQHPKFTYTVAAEAEDQKDLITARELNKQEGSTDNENAGIIHLQFKHALTQINFSLKGQDPNLSYEVSEIKITDAASQGTYSFNQDKFIASDDSKTTYNYNTKTIPLGQEEYLSFGHGNASIDAESVEDNQALMLMPQAFTGSIEVTYTIKTKDGGTVAQNKEATVSFADNGTVWEAGKKIRYNLTLPIGSSKIEFNADITGWEDPETGI